MDRAETVPAAGDERPTFQRKDVLLLSGAHLAHDTYPAFLGVMLPLLIDELHLSLAVAGFLASGLRWTTSLQPFLGHLADRTDTRWWVILAPAITATGMSLIGIAPTTTAVMALLLLTGLSHAAFHPAGGAMATRASGNEWGKGTSYFMTGGEIGRVIGPIFIAAVLALGGLRLSPIAVIPGIITSLVLLRRLRDRPALGGPGKERARIREALRAGRRTLFVLGAAIVLRSGANVSVVVFYPTFATSRGSTLLLAGLALTVYEVGAVFGAFWGGILSDRFGRTRLMILGVLAAGPPMVLAILWGPTLLGLAMLLIGGFGWLSGNSIELVTMQELLPGNRSTAVGLTYFVKAAGAITGTIVVGAAGDVFGLQAALIGAVIIGMLSAPVLAAMKDPARNGGALP
jgi:FSR family fosmidomycin resistance protein-like MFS transporter